MGRMHSLPKLSAVTLLISQTLFTVPAFAAGFQLNEISPSLQGDATAGAAAANNDVSSMFTNPATLSTLIENQFYIGGSEIMPNVSMTNASATHTVNVPGIPASSISAPVQGVNFQNSVSSSAFAPNSYLGWRINKKLVAGIAIVAPYGLTTSYDDNSVLRFMADNSSVEAVAINPALAYAINDKWSIGLGFQAQYMRATFSNFNGTYTGIGSLDTLLAASYPTYVKGSSWGYGYTLGVLFKPDLYTRLGAGFRSQVSENLKGEGRQYVSPGGIVPAPSSAFLFNGESSVTAGVKTPAVLTLSAARDIGNWTVKASAQANFWNSFNQLSINMPSAFATSSTLQTKWKNTWLGALGADYHLTSAWTLRAGVAYDQTPTQDTYRDPRIPDADRIWLAAGVSCKLNKNLSLDGSYTHIFFRDQTINVTQATGSSATSTVPLEMNKAYAKFKGSAEVVGLAVRYSF
jgi:long-chain fatty acid transport protein